MVEVRDGSSGVTLSEFAGMTADAVSQGLTKDALRKGAIEDSAKMGTWIKTAKLDSVSGLVGQRLVGALQDDMAGIFARVWNDCVELKRCAEETKTKPEASTVVLTDHEFSYEVQPEVDVYLARVECGAFKFVVKMLCTVSALAVELKQGCVTGVRAGSCAGGAEITLAGQSIWKREFLHADLPGELKLKEPLRLV